MRGLPEPRVRTMEIYGNLTVFRFNPNIFLFFLLPRGSLCRRVSVRSGRVSVRPALRSRSGRAAAREVRPCSLCCNPRGRGPGRRSGSATSRGPAPTTVGFHNFNLPIFNLRIPNPNKLIVYVFLTRCRISMCQSPGPKNTMKFQKSTAPHHIMICKSNRSLISLEILL